MVKIHYSPATVYGDKSKTPLDFFWEGLDADDPRVRIPLFKAYYLSAGEILFITQEKSKRFSTQAIKNRSAAAVFMFSVSGNNNSPAFFAGDFLLGKKPGLFTPVT